MRHLVDFPPLRVVVSSSDPRIIERHISRMHPRDAWVVVKDGYIESCHHHVTAGTLLQAIEACGYTEIAARLAPSALAAGECAQIRQQCERLKATLPAGHPARIKLAETAQFAFQAEALLGLAAMRGAE